MIAGETKARNAPASDVAKLEVAAGRENPGERCTTSIGRTEDGAYAGARDVGDCDVILFKDLEHAEMGESAGESAPESERDTRPMRGDGRFCTAANWDTRLHVARMRLEAGMSNGKHVLY